MNSNDYTSPTPDFHSAKRMCAVAAKEGRDVGTGHLPAFFLQIEANEEDDPIYVKTTGVLALLLVECDERWRKHWREESGKWVAHAVCNKVVYGATNKALAAYKILSKFLKKWDFVMPL